MTISSTGTRYSYSGNGSTTAFSFPRQFFLDSDLDVYLVNNTSGVATLQVLNTHYTVAGAGSPSGGTVTMLTAPAAGTTLVIFRDTPFTQSLDLDNVTAFPMTSIEAAFDRAMMAIDEIATKIGRAVMAPLTRLGTFDFTLPAPVASKVIGINATADGLELRSPQTWTDGVGGPAGAAGSIGDYYLDDATGNVYLKTGATTWTIQASIKGPQGLQGPQGTTGNTGPQGFQGFQGPAGPQGFQGFQGPAGPQGFQGFQGPGGTNGTNGTNGSAGAQGPQGPAGISGSGTGDVLGPASSTNNNLAGFSGTSGKQLLDSGVSIGALLLTSNLGSSVQAWDADLDSIAALAGTSGLLRKTAANTWSLDTATYLTSLGIGSSTQAWDADLDAIAALATTGVLRRTGTNTWALAAETGTGSVVFGTAPSITNPAFSISAAVTAGTNAQGQGALTSDINVITTAAANPSGVTLPTPAAGRFVLVVNRGANAVNIYPATGHTIDALAANASIQVPATASILFWCQSATAWQSSQNQTLNVSQATGGTLAVARGGTGVTTSTGTGAVVLGTAPALSAPTFGLAAAVTSGTNAQGQGALTTDIAVVTTNAASPGGVTLPTATAGRKVAVYNRTANPLAVFPATGASIDGLAANASIIVPAGASVLFDAQSTTAWLSDQNRYTLIGENAQTGTTYTLAMSDRGQLVSLNNAAAITLTIPTNATVAFPIGTRIDLLQAGAGQVTIGGAGVTIQSSGSKLKLTGQWSGATLYKRGTDTWALIGDITT